MTNLNDQLDFALNQINPTNRAIIMAFVKGIIIPAMVQEEKENNKPKDKPKQKKIVPPKKKKTIKDNSNKISLVLGECSNGHKVQKIKDLDDWEKDSIRASFIDINGEIHEDYCLEILSGLDKDTAIFQVTGFISLLHRYVKKGELVLSNRRSYNNFQKQKRLGNLRSGKKSKKKTKIITLQRD